jgi:site-specific DNA-methyltransferase (adenine-specific)
MSLTLYNGDCLDVMKTIPDASVDLIICDLPYGCLTGSGITKKETAEKYGRKGTEGISGCAWDVKIDLAAFWEQVRRIRKSDDSPTIHFATTKFGHDLICSNEKEFRYDLVWNKQRGVSFLSANKMPMRSHEMIYIFSKAGAYYNRVDISGDFKKSGGGRGNPSNQYGCAMRRFETNNQGKRCVLSVITNATSASRGGHPTEKPIDLYKFLIERYCPAGGTVLDPTFGSGNSGAAAEALGRNYIGIEKDPGFFEKAAKNLGAE